MVTDKLKEAVRKEAIFLRTYASQEQRDKLDFLELNPWSRETCIYGQMTGDCESEDALELFKKCASPFSGGIYNDFGKKGFIEPTKNCYDENTRNEGNYSAIEYYISLPENEYSLKNLTDFLQKKTDTLIL